MSRPRCRCPILVVVVPSSSSCCRRAVLILSVLSSSCCPRPGVVVLSSSCRRCPSRPIIVPLVPSLSLSSHRCPSRPIVVPLILSSFPHSLFLVVWSLSCSSSPVAPTIHPASSGSQRWGWVLGRFVVVIVLLFLVFWSSSRCRVPRGRPVMVVLVPWYCLCHRRHRGRWPPLFVLEHPRSTL